MATAVGRITRQMSEERATILAKEAIELSNSGDGETASRKLREAAALGHDNEDVHKAFLSLHQDHSDSPLLAYCRRYALYHNEKAGIDAIAYLQAPTSSVESSRLVECLQILFETKPSSLSSAQDIIIGELSRKSKEARVYIASQMAISTTEFFDNLYDRGDQAANCLRVIVLDPTLWSSEEIRLRVEDDLFQLFLAKLMESGHDLDGRALRGIALLLMADAQRLHVFVDEEGFDAVLSSLHIRLPSDVRGQATVVLSKLFEVAEESGNRFYAAFIKSHIGKQKNEDLILAFSAAASMFIIAPAITAPLFLTEGFLQSLMPVLGGRKLNGSAVHDVFLALLSAACVDEACRKAISEHCSAWLSDRISNGTDTQRAVAATVLAKLRASNLGQQQSARTNQDQTDIDGLVERFKTSLGTDASKSVPESIEGLAYSSLRSDVKEDLAKDKAFLKTLAQALGANASNPGVVIGGLSIISNITQYRPNLSEEQKKLSQLKAYANASKQVTINPLDNDDHVRLRCSNIVEAGFIPTLIKVSKDSSMAVKQMVARILLSLSRNAKDRGKITQQGAVKLLIAFQQSQSKPNENEATLRFDSGHALARILISLDPAHVFPAGTTPHMTSAIPPLTALLKPESGPVLSDQPRDLLPIFESLLALTNLASSPDQSAANSIIRTAWSDIEDLLLSNNIMIRRASCELVCNLVAFPTGAAKFADDSRRAAQRVHMLLALADVEDVATRRAAGGALAMLIGESPAMSSLLDVPRGVEILLDMCKDEDNGIVQRGMVCLKIIIDATGELGERGRRALKDAEAKRTSTPQSVI